MSFTVAFFWLLPAQWRLHLLVAITASFLGFHSPTSLILLLSLSALTYAIVARSPEQLPGSWVAVGTTVILICLLYYKIQSAAEDDITVNTLIPLGLAYYSLRLIHFLLEAYKGRLPRHSAADFVHYCFFLPTIVVGPINRFPEFHRDLRRHHWDFDMLCDGAERILYGYVKLTFLANYLVSNKFAGFINGVDNGDGALALYLGMVQVGLNLYLQFSGFSDIAIGFSRLLGFKVMENFNWPYLQKNVSDFWRSWHISLTSWCRDYIYTTVFSTTRSPALGALATMIAIGLWHEVSLRYLIWGLYHGAGIAVWQRFQKHKHFLPTPGPRLRRAVDILSILLTVHFIWIGFIIVRQPTLNDAYKYITSMLSFWG